MVGQLVEPHPGDRFAALPVSRELFYRRLFSRNVLMAGAAQGQIGNAGDRTGFDMAVAEATVDLIIAGMHLMAEWDRLCRRPIAGIQRQMVKQGETSQDETG